LFVGGSELEFSADLQHGGFKVSNPNAVVTCSCGESFESGITVGAPGFYGPSSRRIAGVENTVPDIKGALAEIDVDGLRVLNMEMESSLLFHLAGALGHRAGTLCPAISGPSNAATLVDYDARIAVAIDIALEALTVLADAE